MTILDLFSALSILNKYNPEATTRLYGWSFGKDGLNIEFSFNINPDIVDEEDINKLIGFGINPGVNGFYISRDIPK